MIRSVHFDLPLCFCFHRDIDLAVTSVNTMSFLYKQNCDLNGSCTPGHIKGLGLAQQDVMLSARNDPTMTSFLEAPEVTSITKREYVEKKI